MTGNVVLEYYGAFREEGPKARATALARYTRTHVVIDAYAPRTVEQLRGSSRVGLGAGVTLRFRRDNGQRIPYYRFGSGWQLAEWDRGANG